MSVGNGWRGSFHEGAPSLAGRPKIHVITCAGVSHSILLRHFIFRLRRPFFVNQLSDRALSSDQRRTFRHAQAHATASEMTSRLTLLLASLLPLASALVVTSSTPRPFGMHLSRSDVLRVSMYSKMDASDGDACNLLNDKQRASIKEMVASNEDDVDARNQVLETLVVECDEPSEDPSMTCFLTPESWIDDGSGDGASLHADKYVPTSLCAPPCSRLARCSHQKKFGPLPQVLAHPTNHSSPLTLCVPPSLCASQVCVHGDAEPCTPAQGDERRGLILRADEHAVHARVDVHVLTAGCQ